MRPLPLTLILGLLTGLAGPEPARAGEFEDARALFAAKRFPEARAALEQLLAAQPRHAAACHCLGQVLQRRNDRAALDEAETWFARAVELEPENPTYLADWGGVCLLQASRARSYTAATKGRDAMEKALRLDPTNLDAREGLIQFYQRAPWPLGSAAKAAAHVEELRQRDPDRALVLQVMIKSNAKEFAAAFALCAEVLARQPRHYGALYHFGRTAALSGTELTRGLECLRQCLAIEPPTPAAPTHSNVWQRIGNLQELLQQPAEARAAYEAALKLDPGNRQAADALAKLR